MNTKPNYVPLTPKQRLISYRKVLVLINKEIRDLKAERQQKLKEGWSVESLDYEDDRCRPSVFICCKLQDVRQKANVCEPARNYHNNLVTNYPEIAKQKPEDKFYSISWWENSVANLPVRRDAVKTAIVDVLKNNPELL